TGAFAAASGSPAATGTAPVGIAAADFNGDARLDLATANSGAATVSALRNVVSLSLSPVDGALPGATAGTSYSTTFTASGADGAVPPGLTLSTSSPSATLSGTPTTAGTYTFTITATDTGAGGQSVTGSYTMVITTGTGSVPSNTVLPVITGTPSVGSTLSCST